VAYRYEYVDSRRAPSFEPRGRWESLDKKGVAWGQSRLRSLRGGFRSLCGLRSLRGLGSLCRLRGLRGGHVAVGEHPRNVGAIDEDLTHAVRNVIGMRALVTRSHIRMHPGPRGWRASTLDIITAHPNPTEERRLVGVKLEVRELELVLDAVRARVRGLRCAVDVIHLHLKFIGLRRVLFVKADGEGWVQTDRLTLPICQLLPRAVRHIDVVLVADLEIADSFVDRRKWLDLAVRPLGSGAGRQSDQLLRVLRDKVDEVGPFVLLRHMNGHADVVPSPPGAILVVAPQSGGGLGEALVGVGRVRALRGSKTESLIPGPVNPITGIGAPTLDLLL